MKTLITAIAACVMIFSPYCVSAQDVSDTGTVDAKPAGSIDTVSAAADTVPLPVLVPPVDTVSLAESEKPTSKPSLSSSIISQSPLAGKTKEQKSDVELPKSFRKDDKLAQGGIGIFLPGVQGEMTIPPVGAGFEYGAADMVSAGAFFAMSGIKDEDDAKFLVFTLAMKAAFHPVNLPFVPDFNLRNKIDPYICAYAGADIPTNNSGEIRWGLAAGCRYFIRDYFGIYAEAGRGIGYFHVGVTARL